MLVANHQMMQNGAGIISLPVEHIPEFTQRLINYYESGNIEDIKNFVFNVAIDGLDMEKMRDCQNPENSFAEWKTKIDKEKEMEEK